MYSENRIRDAKTFAKACASNLIARFAPAAYVRLTRQTGRGSDDDDVGQIVDYFERCIQDYADRLGLLPSEFDAFVKGRRILEYGPGDILGVSLLMYAAGARHVDCVDRFPLRAMTPKNAAVYRLIIQRLRQQGRSAAAERAEAAFIESGCPESGFRDACINYRVTPNGLSNRPLSYELIVSRAVLEHVNLIDETLEDVELCLGRGGVSVHNVDLKSHNLDRFKPFDFLTWPQWAYQLMYSHKGFPNRWRPDAYRAFTSQTSLRVRSMDATGRLPHEAVVRIRPYLATRFRHVTDDDLSWLGFWLVLENKR